MNKKIFYFGWSDFKNKYGYKYISYHPEILKTMYETMGGLVLEEGFGSISFQELVSFIRSDLRLNRRLEILRPEPICMDLLEYFVGQKNKNRNIL